MSDAKGQHEPSMEEILASIRRIIAEDGDPVAAAPAAAPDAAPAAAPARAPSPSAASAASAAPAVFAEPPSLPRAAAPELEMTEDDDILELTEVVDEDGSVTSKAPLPQDEPPLASVPEPFSFEEVEPEPPPLRSRESAPAPSSLSDRLLSDSAAAASVAALSHLVNRSRREPDVESIALGNVACTLEELVRELLRPMLKTWLDENLPKIVERLVQEEVGRLVLDAQRR
jgi:cell pole-organizing protein PopZ